VASGQYNAADKQIQM